MIWMSKSRATLFSVQQCTFIIIILCIQITGLSHQPVNFNNYSTNENFGTYIIDCLEQTCYVHPACPWQKSVSDKYQSMSVMPF